MLRQPSAKQAGTPTEVHSPEFASSWHALRTRLESTLSQSEIAIWDAMLASRGMPPPGPAQPPHRPARTACALDFVFQAYDQGITLEKAAALCRLSPSQFSRVFRAEHGLSFGKYLLRYRIDRACELLALPGSLAKDVAYSVGFNDLSYFARAFKRRVGISPSEYRAKARLS